MGNLSAGLARPLYNSKVMPDAPLNAERPALGRIILTWKGGELLCL